MDAILKYLFFEKTQKPFSMRLLYNIAHTFRFLQLCTSLLLVYWILTRLSFLLQISRHYFQTLTSLLSTPIFVFLISNFIILSLLANNRRLIGQNFDNVEIEIDLLREFARHSDHHLHILHADHHHIPRADSASELFDYDEQSCFRDEEEEIMECEDKEVVSDDNTVEIDPTVRAEIDDCTDTESIAEIYEPEFEYPRVYRRSRSENLTGEVDRKSNRSLRRSETERMVGENDENVFAYHDKLSSEEFQRTIEAFIAKQKGFLREEESIDIVVRKQS